MSKDLINQEETEKLPYCSENFNSLFEHIKIQTNNLCTRKCPYCYYGNKVDLSISNQFLPSDYVYKVVDELAELGYSGRLGFFEINEPLTDKRIYNFIEYASKKLPSAWQMLITNGDLLTLESLRRLFEAGLKKLYISIYDQEALSRLVALREMNPLYFLDVEFMNFTNEIFIDNRGGSLDNYELSEKLKQSVSRPCERVYKIMYVRPSGNVVSCASDFYEANILGNVSNQSLKEIWFGNKYKELRKELDNGNRDYSTLCAKCNYGGKGGFFNKVK